MLILLSVQLLVIVATYLSLLWANRQPPPSRGFHPSSLLTSYIIISHWVVPPSPPSSIDVESSYRLSKHHARRAARLTLP
ncbi:hypothetical protein FIBSPDRAFT_126732 [Athelia psychrophila]|uniref:Secreted peptide n=1 Tax=Athelia psychrophila TaxID=1759441 RepID=A0A166T826_9AGAM|nr:hypothetical protein FIBSPDRAFT_126732 [Fibularhizoctonia sp. CBS 109695]